MSPTAHRSACVPNLSRFEVEEPIGELSTDELTELTEVLWDLHDRLLDVRIDLETKVPGLWHTLAKPTMNALDCLFLDRGAPLHEFAEAATRELRSRR